jgi:hypothetical protein
MAHSARRPLDGRLQSRPGSNAFGRLTDPDGRTLIVEAVSDSSRGYGFVCTETGRSFAVPADGRWQWQFLPRDRLLALTGLDVRPYSDGGYEWRGSWQTKLRRNPVMRGIQAAALELDVPCGTTEFQAVILNEPLGPYDTHRRNTTAEFASAVADRVDHDSQPLEAAIAAQFERDLRLALVAPAIAATFSGADDYATWLSRGGRTNVNLWNGRGRLVVRSDRLRAAARLDALERHASDAVAAARTAIERERRDALADQHAGQLALL